MLHTTPKRPLFTICLAALLLYGCSMPTGSSAPDATSGAVLKTHLIQNEELRMMMRELQTVVDDDPKSELERDDARRRYALRVAGTIENIAQKIKRLPETRPLLENEAEKQRFLGYADALDREGRRLRSLALAYETEKIEPQMARVNRVCNACHSDFRDLREDLRRRER